MTFTLLKRQRVQAGRQVIKSVHQASVFSVAVTDVTLQSTSHTFLPGFVHFCEISPLQQPQRRVVSI